MADASIRAVLGLNTTDWRKSSTDVKADLDQLTQKTTVYKAAVALLEREMVGKGTAEQIKQHRELQAELVKTERAAKQTARQFAAIEAAKPPAPPPTPTPSNPHGGGNQRMRNAELAHSARSVIDMLVAGQNPLQAIQMEAPRVIQAFGGGIGTIMGVGAAVAGVTALIGKTIEAGEHAKELKRDFAEALRAGPTSGTQSAEAIHGRVDELDSVLHKNGPVTGVMSRLGQFINDRLASSYEKVDRGDFGIHFGKGGGVDAGEERRQGVEDTEKRRKEMLEQEVAVQQRLNDLKDRAYKSGEDTVRIAEIQLQTQNKIAAAEEALGLPKLREDYKLARTPEEKTRIQHEIEAKQPAFEGQRTEIQRGGDIEVKAELRRQVLLAQTMGLENALLLIKQHGADVDVESAKAKLASARTVLQTGPDSGEGYAANEERVNAAKEELRVAERTREERLEGRVKGTCRRLKRKVRVLTAQKVGLLRELIAAQARYNRLAVREHVRGEKK